MNVLPSLSNNDEQPPIDASATPTELAPSVVHELQKELTTIVKCENLLLRFLREAREIMHQCKAEQTRLMVWTETTAMVKNIQRDRIQSLEAEKDVVDLVRRKLPRNPTQYIASGQIGQKMRLMLARTHRKWTPKQSIKLRDIVAEAFRLALVQLKVDEEEYLGNVQPCDLIGFRERLLIEYEHADPANKEQVAFIFSALQELLAKKEERDPQRFPVELFWREVWDSIAEALAENPPRSGRDCQIHWAFNYHPTVNRSEIWPKEEEARMLELLQQLGGGRWKEIADRLGTNRTAFDVYSHYQKALNVDLTTSSWTREEIQTLTDTVRQFRGEASRRWADATLKLPNKTAEQCRLKYHSLRTEGGVVIQGHWTIEEDLRLQVLVHLIGRGNWVRVAEFMPQRTAIKCRERYENMLAPDLDKSEWTKTEDEALLRAVDEFGWGAWSLIQQRVKGRTDADCYKRWTKLDPLNRSKHSMDKATRAICIPSQSRKRREKPSLNLSDFNMAMTEQIQRLLNHSMRTNEALYGHSLMKKRRGRPPLRLTAENETSAPDQLTALSDDPSLPDRLGRLRALGYYLTRITTGKKQADALIKFPKKLLMETRAMNLRVPLHMLKALDPLSNEQKLAIDDMISKGLTIADVEQSSYLGGEPASSYLGEPTAPTALTSEEHYSQRQERLNVKTFIEALSEGQLECINWLKSAFKISEDISHNALLAGSK